MKLLRRFQDFAPWDTAGIAAHLEEMEQKGWRFRGTDVLGRWEYVSCEAAAVQWAVAYAPSRSGWRLTPTEQERDLEDLCFEAGWRKIAALSMFHIYRNPDADATPLESDEVARLDIMDRALNHPISIRAAAWSFWSIAILGLLGKSMGDDLPRFLAMPTLPGVLLFLLWVTASSAIPWVMYRKFRSAARNAAHTGLPCPSVTGWNRFSEINHAVMAVLLLWIISAGKLALVLGYAAVLGAVEMLRRFLPRLVRDDIQAEQLWQTALVVAVIAIAGLNLWCNRTDQSTEVEAIPLMAQDLMDTEGMQLKQFDYNDSDGPVASYHNYWQSDYINKLDIQYTVFDQHFPLFERACETQFTESFHTIAARDGLTVTEADADAWGAQRVLFSTKPGKDQWLIFYNGRTVQLFTSWNLTLEQIEAAAEKLAP